MAQSGEKMSKATKDGIDLAMSQTSSESRRSETKTKDGRSRSGSWSTCGKNRWNLNSGPRLTEAFERFPVSSTFGYKIAKIYWVGGSPSGEDLARAGAAVVDALADELRRHYDGLGR